MDLLGLDLTTKLMQASDYSDFCFLDGKLHRGRGAVVLHVNSPLIPLALCRLGRDILKKKYIIGYWAWELPETPPDWRHGVPYVHEIWVPSAFVAEAVRPVAGGRPVRVVAHPVAMSARPVNQVTRPTDRPFTALVVFNVASSFTRKYPVAAIRAFRRAFGDDRSAWLVVKTSNSQAFPGSIAQIRDSIGLASNIVLIDQVFGAAEMDALYRASDVVVSLHRSEGFGLTIAEAMLRGLPVLATNWSGSTDFVTAQVGFPIPYSLVPAVDPQSTYQHPSMVWADPDVEAAADALRTLYENPKLARSLGQAGAEYAARTWSAQAYAETVQGYLGCLGS